MRELKFILDRQSLQVIYFSFIRPYADVVLDNYTQYEANEIEKKKKKKKMGAARIVMDATRAIVVQNLTKLLANVTSKFLSWNMVNTLILFAEKNVSSFCIAKATHIFAAKTVIEFVINEPIKLTALWTTGPRLISIDSLRTEIG